MSCIVDIQKIFENFVPPPYSKEFITFEQWVEKQLEDGKIFQCRHCEEYFENEHDLDQYGICEDCQKEQGEGYAMHLENEPMKGDSQ